MRVKKIVGLLLLALGVLVLVYRGFTYTKETHDARLGPLEFSVKEKQRVTIPVWAGVLFVAAGAGVLVFPLRGQGR